MVGVDGHPLAAVLGLTTVDQGVVDQGRLSGEIALRLIAGRPAADLHEVVPTRLIVRETTGPVRR